MTHEFVPTSRLLRCAWGISAILATVLVFSFVAGLAARHGGQVHFANVRPVVAASPAPLAATARGPLATADGVTGFPAKPATSGTNPVFAQDRKR